MSRALRFALIAMAAVAIIASGTEKAPAYSANRPLQLALLDPAIRSGPPTYRPGICMAINMTEAIGWGCYRSTAENGPPIPGFELPTELQELMRDQRLRDRYGSLEEQARQTLGTCYSQGRNPDRCESAYVDALERTHASLQPPDDARLRDGLVELRRQIQRSARARRTAKRFGGHINGQTTTLIGNLFLQDDFNQSLAAARKQGECAAWIRHYDHNRCGEMLSPEVRRASPGNPAAP